jgi:hypothetical protein
MSVVLPNSINYADGLPSLPDATTQIPIAASPVNGTNFAPGAQVQFDLVNRGFLVPDSMYISYNATQTQTAFQTNLIGCPVYTPINRLDVQVGSQTIDTIQNYNNVMNMLSNTTLDVAQKFGLQSAFGYNNNTTAAPSLDLLDSRDFGATAGTFTWQVSAPLMNVLSNAEKLLPLFAMPQVRITLTLDAIANIFAIASGGAVSAVAYSNWELRYKVVDMGGAVEQMVLSMGDKIYVKSQSFASSSNTLASGSTGYIELIYNQRYASVKSLFAINGCTAATSVNKAFDSVDITTNNGEYSFSVGGVIYPQRALSSLVNRAGILQELRSALGSVYDRNNAFAISSVEFLYNSGSTTTAAAPGKFYIGTSVEKLNSDSLLTGISTQNSPISYRISTGTATGQVHTITLVVNYDALFEIDTVNRQTALKC